LASTYDPIYKVNPPLRSARHVEALRQALAEGIIDIVATDHAPHTTEDKECEWAAASFGMLGLQTALAVVNETMVRPGLLDWVQVAERMSSKPAQIGRVRDHGRPIDVGEPANLLVFDPQPEWVVEASDMVSRSRNTPYRAMVLHGRVMGTWLRGRPTVLDGRIVEFEAV
jgi:dihydroorotase